MKIVFTLVMTFGLLAMGTDPKSLSKTPLNELYPQSPIAPTAQEEFLSAFFSLLPMLRESGLSLDVWFREDHISYVSEMLSDGEKRELIPVFERIGENVRSGKRDMKEILTLAGAGPSAIAMAKAGAINTEVRRLKEQHKDVIRLALQKHEIEHGQQYGTLPYSYHLRQVRGVLKRFGFGPKDSVFGLRVGMSAWLHDILEDTDVKYEELEGLVGSGIATIVLGVTKIKDASLSDEECLTRTYTRASKNQGSRILKLADRIANVEEGILDLFSGRPSKVQKYFGEQTIFRKLLYVGGDADAMWDHLDRLLGDRAYAQHFAMRYMNQRDCRSLITQ